MEPPSSDAEALRDQQAAQVRATNGLFVTADEFRHLECGQQAIWQSFVQGRRLRHLADHVRSMRRFRVRDAGHDHPPHTCGAERRVRRQTVDERLEPVGPQRVMDLRSITRLRRLGAAGSEQSMARTLTGAMTRPINASRQGATRPAPRCSAKRPVLKSRRTRKRLCFKGCRPSVVRIDAAVMMTKPLILASRAVSGCLRFPGVVWASRLRLSAPTRLSGASSRALRATGRKRIPRGLWPSWRVAINRHNE